MSPDVRAIPLGCSILESVAAISCRAPDALGSLSLEGEHSPHVPDKLDEGPFGLDLLQAPDQKLP